MQARIKRIKISPEALVNVMVNDTAWRVKKGVPSGAKVRGFTLDPYTSELNIFIEHYTFDYVNLSEVAPLLETEFHKIK